MAVIINAHNKNMPGSCTPALHCTLRFMGRQLPLRDSPGEQQLTREHQRKAVQNHQLSTDLFYCVVKDCT